MTSGTISALQSDILNAYYDDNAKKLHKVVDRILCRFGGLSNKDLDDFYSLANEVFTDIMKRYDDSQSFDGFLYSCLSNKIMSEITRRNREKRRADRMCVSLDTPIGDSDGLTIGNIIADDFDTFEEVNKMQGNGQYHDKASRYIARLSDRQVSILNLLIDGYRPGEIQRILEISSKEYADNLQTMRSYENIKILF